MPTLDQLTAAADQAAAKAAAARDAADRAHTEEQARRQERYRRTRPAGGRRVRPPEIEA